MGWPETVPVITPQHIHKGWSEDESGKKKCALRIIGDVFGDRACAATEELRKVAGDPISLVAWNDGKTTKKEIAAALNQTFANLGYTEDA
jgi:hypothetical protein